MSRSKADRIADTAELFIQRKYNGLRCLATWAGDSCALYSRGLNRYVGFDYIRKELAPVIAEYPGLHLDGEIYGHGVPLQVISGDARRAGDHPDRKYVYQIYDCFVPAEPDMTLSERAEMLDMIFSGTEFTYCLRVETAPVTKAEIKGKFDEFVAEGYEGAMIRLDLPYEYGVNHHRSKSLLKLKEEFDDELAIAGWETGRKGKAAEALMIRCAAANGTVFPVTPAMELPVRIELARKMPIVESNGKTHFENHWLGKKIIVTYDELSKDGIPQRARTSMEERTWD